MRISYFNDKAFVDDIRTYMTYGIRKQRRLAEAIGVSVSSLSSILRRKTLPSIQTAVALAIVCDLDLNRYIKYPNK